MTRSAKRVGSTARTETDWAKIHVNSKKPDHNGSERQRQSDSGGISRRAPPCLSEWLLFLGEFRSRAFRDFHLAPFWVRFLFKLMILKATGFGLFSILPICNQLPSNGSASVSQFPTAISNFPCPARRFVLPRRSNFNYFPSQPLGDRAPIGLLYQIDSKRYSGSLQKQGSARRKPRFRLDPSPDCSQSICHLPFPASGFRFPVQNGTRKRRYQSIKSNLTAYAVFVNNAFRLPKDQTLAPHFVVDNLQ